MSCKIENLEYKLALAIECCTGQLCNSDRRPQIPHEGEAITCVSMLSQENREAMVVVVERVSDFGGRG